MLEKTSSSLPDHFTGCFDLAFAGYVPRRKLLFTYPVPVFTFRSRADSPLTFWPRNEPYIRPFRTFDGYDFGSVPLILQGLETPLFCPKSTANHDSVYEFHAWWRPWGVEEVTQHAADDMLYRMARAEYECAMPDLPEAGWFERTARRLNGFGSRLEAGKAWLAVRVGGDGSWEKDTVTLENARRIANLDALLRSAEVQFASPES